MLGLVECTAIGILAVIIVAVISLYVHCAIRYPSDQFLPTTIRSIFDEYKETEAAYGHHLIDSFFNMPLLTCTNLAVVSNAFLVAFQHWVLEPPQEAASQESKENGIGGMVMRWYNQDTIEFTTGHDWKLISIIQTGIWLLLALAFLFSVYQFCQRVQARVEASLRPKRRWI